MKSLTRDIKKASVDSTTNKLMRDVIGNKSDAAAAGSVTTTESLMAYVKQLVGSQPEFVSGLTDTTPLASMNLFTITGGPVMIHEVFGVVTTTAIQAQATTIKLQLDPTDGGTDVDLCSAGLDATGDATGTIYRLTKDFSEALIALLDVSEATDIQAPGVICQPGNIKVVYGDTSTGQINWYCIYSRLGGVLTTATA